MSGWAAKRFWTQATVVPADQGFTVSLDGRALKTPAKTSFWVPSQGLADAVAQEWQAQDGKIRPETMPFTRTANSALDKVTPQFAAVADMLAGYGGSDLLCYRAAAPQELVARQAHAWDPLLAWAAATYDAPLTVTIGLMPIDQPDAPKAALARAVHALTPFQLAAFHDLVAITGSLVLALAIAHGHLTPDAGFDLSRTDEQWQIDLWGPDDEAAESEGHKRVSVAHAARFFTLCG
ncbi:Chaperone required for the assembly of the F1-ATPase [Pseudorhodobacter antarcticus]|jgi:chaperone required for assembly of F1-ATPase|uniref:Chaperone required for the assembly of the F1-ATPase n=1 Tax=Pseudorhodobacter antarcticus TaxID=1077947 RepID=A0A1H8EUZ5_9RHOB|nr:ATP12 family protein [Pseudorhodobacter antarcticus]SEN23210.1 Chaperone required for the assembly of the F1-ATPase [Pseudorhodobacter antarcticus]